MKRRIFRGRFANLSPDRVTQALIDVCKLTDAPQWIDGEGNPITCDDMVKLIRSNDPIVQQYLHVVTMAAVGAVEALVDSRLNKS